MLKSSYGLDSRQNCRDFNVLVPTLHKHMAQNLRINPYEEVYAYTHTKKNASRDFDPYMVDMLMARNAYGEVLL